MLNVLRDTLENMRRGNVVIDTNTRVLINQRIVEILSSLKEGLPKRQIKDNLISKYNISESTVDKDFSEANKLLSEQMDLTAEAYKYLLNARLENIYSKAILKNDLKSALGVVQQQIKLNGLGIEKQSIDLNDNTFEIKLN